MSDIAKTPTFEVLEHSGDLRFLARGGSFLEALAVASQGLVGQIVDLDTIEERDQRAVEISGDDDSQRAVALLNELLYLAYAKRWLAKRVRVLTHCTQKGCREITAILAGEALDFQKHEIKFEIKAVTFHEFRIKESNGVWSIEFVCDL